MLETFRKHHYVLMCLIAVAVIISFTFFFSPNSGHGGSGGSSQRVGTLYGRDFTLGEVETISGEQRIAAQLAQQAMDREGNDPVSQFGQAIGDLVNTAATDEKHLDLDYPTNILVMRKECENLGIEVEREDIEKFIKQIGAFRTNGAFEAKKLETFLTGGTHGDRAATETKLFATLRDVMLFQRLAQTVGGSFAPSPAEVEADYAQAHQKTTAATVLIDKKAHETQTVTDEEIQKFYDAEKAKKEAVAKPDDKTPLPTADPLVLSEEKRTVKYVITEAPKPPSPPVAPSPPPSPLPMGDVTGLPEEEKKLKEEEYKKRQDEYKVQQEAHTKSMADHSKAMEEHQKKVKESAGAKTAWLKNVAALCDALVAEDRGGKSFEELAKLIAPVAPSAPVVPAPVVPAPVVPAPVVPAPVVPAPVVPAPVVPAPGDPSPKPAEGSAKPVECGAKPAEEDAKPTDGPAKPAEDSSKPVEVPAEPAEDAAPPEVPAKPVEVPGTKPVEDPAKPAPDAKPAAEPAKPEPFGVKTVTFTSAAAPEDLKKISASGGDAAKIIFGAKLNDTEMWIEAQGQEAYCFFQVTGIETAALLPFEEVKQKISDRLKKDKVDAALTSAADDARSSILEAIKGGKSFKDAAAGLMLTATELPAFSKKTPLPPATANAQLISSTITGEAGMGAPAQPGLQSGEISTPLKVPEGLLLVYVEKKELPKHPEMEQQKKALVQKHTFHNAGAELVRPQYDQQKGIQAYIDAEQLYREEAGYFGGNYGSMTNPVLKAWFAARRAEAQAVQ